MGIRELRQHIRFRTEDKAHLRLRGGLYIPCSIQDISMGGAYLVREGEPSRAVDIQPGERARIRIHDLGAGERYTLSAEIVRVEPNGGRGIAIRFRLTEETVDPVFDHVGATARLNGYSPEVLRFPTLSKGRAGSTPIQRISHAVFRLSVLGALAGFAIVGATWLDSTIF